MRMYKTIFPRSNFDIKQFHIRRTENCATLVEARIILLTRKDEKEYISFEIKVMKRG